MLVYDITNRDSFDSLDNWHEDLLENSPEDVIKIVIGNKIDLNSEEVAI